MNTAQVRPSRRARWTAALTALALAAAGAILAVAPATAAPATPGTVTSGTATWGLSTYLNAGSFGRPSPLSGQYTPPASYDATTKLSSWGNATGHVNSDGSAELAFAGRSVNFTATGGGWVTFADLEATLDASGNGSVSAVVSYGLAPGTFPDIVFDPAQAPERGPERVTIVTLAGNTVGATMGVGTAQWSGLAGSWSTEFLAYLQGDAAATPAIPAWAYASAFDGAVGAIRLASPFAFSVGISPYPTHVPTSYNGGAATWGLSTYLNAGAFGRPSPLPAHYVAPASYDATTKLSTWGNGSGQVNGDGSATLAYEGQSVNFTATGGGWIKLADPQVALDANGNGSVTAEVTYGLAPGVFPDITFDPDQTPQRGPERVEIVALAGNVAPPVQTSTGISWAGLSGSWSSALLTYLQGDSSASIPAWPYASAITNDASVGGGVRLASPFSFALSSVPLIATTPVLTTSPAAPVIAGTSVTLRAAVTPVVPGEIVFRSGDSVLGAQRVDGAGAAVIALGSLAAGSYSYTATFTPDDGLHYAVGSAALTLPVDAPVVAAAGSLTWGVKQSLQSYVLGGGSISTASGAGTSGSRFTFPQTTSSGFDHAARTGSSFYAGGVTFSYPAHGFAITIANPRVQLTSATTGTLYTDVTYNGTTRGGVAFASLGLAGATVSTANGASTFSNVTASLTAAGATSFAGFYAAGEALDPLSFVVGSASGGFAGSTKSAAVTRTPADTPPATTGVTLGDGVDAGALEEGEEYTFTADGFTANETGILAVIYSTPTVLSSAVKADASGAVTWTGALPQGLTGDHTFTFQGSVDRGIEVTIAPAAAATTALEGCSVEDASLTWGFKESFRSYISGSIANGEWTVADGAEYATPNFSWADGTGVYDAETATGELAFTGSIRFTGHGGVLDTTVANPVIRFIDEDNAVVLLDVSGTTQDGSAVQSDGVEFVELDLSTATVEVVDGAVTITDAPATLTAAGAAAFGTYPEGEAFDALTVAFTTADCAAEAVPADGAPSTDVDAEPVSDTGFPWIWIVLALVALIAIIIVVAVVLRRRRTAE